MNFLGWSLEQPGLLHIFFGALEESVVAQAEWKGVEKQLEAFVKICSEKAYKERVIEKRFQHATRELQRMFHRRYGRIIDWRSEHLEDGLEEVPPLYEPFQRWFMPGEFMEAGTFIQDIERMLASELSLCFSEMLLVVTKAVAREASWIEGCFDHDGLLRNESSYKKRRSAMIEETGSSSCPWKGKRMTGFALGVARVMCQRVREATSPRYQAVLLRVKVSVSTLAIAREKNCKDPWCAFIMDKTDFYIHIPHKVCVGAAIDTSAKVHFRITHKKRRS